MDAAAGIDHDERRAVYRRGAGAFGATLVCLTIAIASFVVFEPAPYEILVLVCLVLLLACGLRVHRRLAPFLFLMVAIAAFGMPAVLMADPMDDAAMYHVVTVFLIGTSIFFAAYVAEDPLRRMKMISWAYVVAASASATAAIIGYFGLIPGAELFTLYGRARGTFHDPNVFSPFMIYPAMFIAYRFLNARPAAMIPLGGLVLLFTFAVLLTFSRGAWGHFVFSSAVMLHLTFVLSNSPRERLRITLIAFAGIAAVIALLAIALSFDAISILFQERANLTQSYDVGHLGRFRRQVLGLEMALERPLGLGGLEFQKYFFPEDPHNVYLNALLSYGWGGRHRLSDGGDHDAVARLQRPDGGNALASLHDRRLFDIRRAGA